ncbi:MAG: nucleotidyltransferase domain-containing protein [Spirochaetes bacterium]|nr:MAG: nucleotidyltransferase domain-containing protein [Spirochaetota bacterium]
MRLHEKEIHAIKDAVRKHFGKSAAVYLFGSRVDDTKRGGDIDLLVEHSPELSGSDVIKRKLKTMTDIQFAIGDRKIDIITTTPEKWNSMKNEEREPLIIRKARREAVPL